MRKTVPWQPNFCATCSTDATMVASAGRPPVVPMRDETSYCPQCAEERPVRKTVPWQPNLCGTCSAELEEEEA